MPGAAETMGVGALPGHLLVSAAITAGSQVANQTLTPTSLGSRQARRQGLRSARVAVRGAGLDLGQRGELRPPPAAAAGSSKADLFRFRLSGETMDRKMTLSMPRTISSSVSATGWPRPAESVSRVDHPGVSPRRQKEGRETPSATTARRGRRRLCGSSRPMATSRRALARAAPNLRQNVYFRRL